MAARANWKGHLKLGLVTCPVALYTAASESERISFHTLNRKTGHRIQRQFVDSDTGKLVERESQVKGYEVGKGDYVVLTDEDIEDAIPESTKTIGVEAFIPADKMDEAFLDKPYYLAPTDKTGEEAFVLIRRAMEEKKVVGIARTMLFRRCRVLMLRPAGPGLTATTLHFDYEIRSAAETFKEVPKLDLSKEMIDLAKHIISTKRGKFDPQARRPLRERRRRPDPRQAAGQGDQGPAPSRPWRQRRQPAGRAASECRREDGLSPKAPAERKKKTAARAAKRPAAATPRRKAS